MFFYGAGLITLALFVTAFSFIYFNEFNGKTHKERDTEQRQGKNKPGYVHHEKAVSHGMKLHDTGETEKEKVQATAIEKQNVKDDGKQKMQSLAPKNVVISQQQMTGEKAVVAYAPSINERKTRGGSTSVTTENGKNISTSTAGKIVIIIDDLGSNMDVAKELLSMDKRITFSVLPKLKYSKDIADAVSLQNKEVILHLPMEPVNHKHKPGPGAITDGMTLAQIQKQVDEDVKSVPHIDGMNNHMGSKATSNEKIMESVLSVAKEDGLFYVDSVTSPKSKGYSTARKLNLPTAKRDVFLDGVQNKAYVKSQLIKLKELAKKKGIAVGIGHPHPSTVEALKEMLPQLEKEGFQIVPASEVVK